MLALGANGRGRAGLLSALRPQDVFQILAQPANQMQAAINALPFSPDILIDKDRIATGDWSWRNSARGFDKTLASNTTTAEAAWPGYSGTNNRVVFALKQQAKVAVCVPYTGDGASGRVIPHALGITPGMVIVKALNFAPSAWPVLVPSGGAQRFLLLNGTNAGTSTTNDPPMTRGYVSNLSSTTFSVTAGFDSIDAVNAAGQLYVAYLFAHDPDTTNGIVQCGSYTGTGAAGKAIDTGYPVQWALVKRTDSTSDWGIMDLSRASFDAPLYANLSAAEGSQDIFDTTATGLVTKSSAFNVSGGSYAYCLIRAPIT